MIYVRSFIEVSMRVYLQKKRRENNKDLHNIYNLNTVDPSSNPLQTPYVKKYNYRFRISQAS
jgi:hypothetical protein